MHLAYNKGILYCYVKELAASIENAKIDFYYKKNQDESCSIYIKLRTRYAYAFFTPFSFNKYESDFAGLDDIPEGATFIQMVQ